MLTRRELLAAAGTAALAGCGAQPKRRWSPASIEHVVFLIQENRSFDHYFGRYPGARGLGADPSRFAQGGVAPFALREACVADVTHEWDSAHGAWNLGRNDRFVAESVKKDGPTARRLPMGYYEPADLPFHHALARAFTLCDGYHSSVLGPTDSNRLYTMSATLDPGGRAGGPVLVTYTPQQRKPRLSWTTMPEQLQDRGVPWKVYTHPAGFRRSAFTLFTKFASGVYHERGIAPLWPRDFEADIARGELPAVSWVHLPEHATEHPSHSSPPAGAHDIARVLRAVMERPDVWAKTVVFLVWDENGGFFDHVAPPTAPRGTPGEYLTVARLPEAAAGIHGPIGLGFRVPMIVISPFSRGGHICRDVFDHTSMLRFLESRFDAEVPNLTAWRRRTTGDLVSALGFDHPDFSVPRLPLAPVVAHGGCPPGRAPAHA